MFLLFRFITACETYRFWSFDENFGLSHFVLPFLQVHMSKEKCSIVEMYTFSRRQGKKFMFKAKPPEKS